MASVRRRRQAALLTCSCAKPAVEERAPDGFKNIDDVLSYEERKAIVRGYASTAGYAREQVNRAVGQAA